MPTITGEPRRIQPHEKCARCGVANSEHHGEQHAFVMMPDSRLTYVGATCHRDKKHNSARGCLRWRESGECVACSVGEDS